MFVYTPFSLEALLLLSFPIDYLRDVLIVEDEGMLNVSLICVHICHADYLHA